MSESCVDWKNDNLKQNIDDLVGLVDDSRESRFNGKVHCSITKSEQSESFEMRLNFSDVETDVKRFNRQSVVRLREHLKENVDGDFVQDQVDCSLSVHSSEGGLVMADDFQPVESQFGCGVKTKHLQIDIFDVEVRQPNQVRVDQANVNSERKFPCYFVKIFCNFFFNSPQKVTEFFKVKLKVFDIERVKWRNSELRPSCLEIFALTFDELSHPFVDLNAAAIDELSRDIVNCLTYFITFFPKIL